jgi:hypothetical protein
VLQKTTRLEQLQYSIDLELDFLNSIQRSMMNGGCLWVSHVNLELIPKLQEFNIHVIVVPGNYSEEKLLEMKGVVVAPDWFRGKWIEEKGI